MGGINGTGGIMKLVTFILVTATFALSIWLYNTASTWNVVLAGAVIGGFFGYYLAAFIGMMCGGEIDSEVAKTWAIYGCASLFGTSIKIIMDFQNARANDYNNTNIICLVCGFMALASSVFCFLDAIFSK